jgi:hypothetical protein
MQGHQVLLRTKDTPVLPCDKDAVLLNAPVNLLNKEGKKIKSSHPLGFCSRWSAPSHARSVEFEKEIEYC